MAHWNIHERNVEEHIRMSSRWDFEKLLELFQRINLNKQQRSYAKNIFMNIYDLHHSDDTHEVSIAEAKRAEAAHDFESVAMLQHGAKQIGRDGSGRKALIEFGCNRKHFREIEWQKLFPKLTGTIPSSSLITQGHTFLSF